MEYVLDDLRAREEELSEYLKLIEFLSKNVNISGKNGDLFQVTPLLLKTTKGSVYLLLYSLVESIIRESIIEIHEEIERSNSSFDDLREELQLKILRRAQRDGINIKELLSQTSSNVSLNLHKATLNRNHLFSGNVDSSNISKVAKIYGFSSSTQFSRTGHGAQVNTVKTYRNDLAHGNKTFAAVGGQVTTEELQDFSKKVIAYIYEIIDNIQDGLEGRVYLRINMP